MPWATIQQVTDQTGKTVDASALALASSIIDTYAGTDPAMPEASITARDRAILRKATAWQAVWIAGQPGYLEHRGVDYSPSADGTSSQRKSQADQDLAPLAQRELKNLSWVGTGVVNLRGGRTVPKGALMTDFLNESSDWWSGDGGGWGSGGSGGSSSGGLTGWQEITGKPLVFPPDLHTHEISEVEGLQAALDAAGGGEGGTVSLAWSEITGKPSTFPPSVHTHVLAWSEISSKPATFPPSAHTHTQGDVTGLGAALGALTPLTTLTEVEQALDAADADLDVRVTALEGASGGGSTVTCTRGHIADVDAMVPEAAAWTAVAGIQWVIPAPVGASLSTTARFLVDMTTQATDFFDVAVLVDGVIVRTASTDTNIPATEGDPALYPSPNVRFRGSESGIDFQVEAEDRDGSGNVTIGLIHRGGTGNAKVYATPTFPFRWSAQVVS
jgi:hypothetical protein